jgi:tetratricopeptide (TPR) repeat protein
MTTAATGPPRRRRGRRVLFALFLAGAGVLAAGLFYGWRRHTPPPPPDVHPEEVDAGLREAIEAARAKVLREPRSAAAWGDLGRLLRDCKLVERAVICFDEAERLEPDDPRWPYLRGMALFWQDPDQALPSLRRAVGLFKPGQTDAVVPRLRLAELLLEKGAYEEAGAVLRRAAETEPDHPAVQLQLGLLDYARGDLEASRAHLLRCQHDPLTRQKAAAQLAALYQRRHNPTEAAAFGRKARSLPPDLPLPDPFRVLSADALVGKQARLSYLDRLRQQRRYGEAVPLLREMAAQDPDSRVYVMLGESLAQLGKQAEAEQALRSALRLDRSSVQANYFLARILLDQAERRRQKGGDGDEAVSRFRAAAEHARRAIAGKPGHALAHIVLGLSLKYLGRRAEALEALRLAVASAPEFPEPHLSLGEVLAEYGRHDEARRQLEQALRLSPPEDPRPRTALDRLAAAAKKGAR